MSTSLRCDVADDLKKVLPTQNSKTQNSKLKTQKLKTKNSKTQKLKTQKLISCLNALRIDFILL
jgi:hypothetical protein